MPNRPKKTALLSVVMAASLGAALFGVAFSRQAERVASSDELQFNLGDERARAARLIAERKRLTEQEAKRYLQELERRKGLRVLNRLSLPNGTVADYVKVSNGRNPVERRGMGVMLNPRSALGRRALQGAMGQPGYEYFLRKWDEAAKQGVFSWRLTEKQRQQLLRGAGSDGAPTRSRQTPVAQRCLVVAVEFPEWVDTAPAYSTNNRRVYYDTLGQRAGVTYYHPISDQNANGLPDSFEFDPTLVPLGETPGGPIAPTFVFANNNSDFTLGAVNWAAQPHPGVRGSAFPQSVDLREQWYTLFFDPVNVNSVTNYYWQNSHGHVRLSGDRSDIVGWLETRHILDRTDIAPNTAPFDAFQPGTPLIRPIAETSGNPVMAYATLNTAVAPAAPTATAPVPPMVNSWITVVWSRAAWSIGGATSSFFYQIESPIGIPKPLISSNIRARVDPFDPRRVVLLVAPNSGNNNLDRIWGNTFRLTFDNGTIAQSVTGAVDGGLDLSFTQGVDPVTFRSNNLFHTGELMGSTGPSDATNPQTPLTPHRLKSYCYYTTDHEFRPGDPYQLLHLRNRLGIIDDIGGNTDDARDHAARPAPYDHDIEDHGRPNGGILGFPPHDVTALRTDINLLLQDNGVDLSLYDRVVYVYPDGGTPPLTPVGVDSDDYAFVPESAGLPTVARNLGVTFGLPYLFDHDSVNPFNPPHRVTHAMGPYSLMASGMRLDPFSKLVADPGPWISTVDIAADRLGQRVPQIEGISDESRVLRLFVPGTTEYFLVENHNQQMFGDTTPLGLSIFHVDPRYAMWYPPDLPPQSGGQNDDLWAMIPEQADGQFELERQLASQALTTLDTDSFGANTAGGVTVWDQYTASLTGVAQTTSRSRGIVDPNGNLQPGTATDSYLRIANISNTGPVMTADIFVEPRELIVTGTVLAPPTAQQGARNVPMLQLDFQHAPQSTNDVTVDSMVLAESGSSKVDTDVTRVSLFDESNGLTGFQPFATGNTPADTLVASQTFSSQQATFQSLAYLVNHSQQRTMYVAYDISELIDTSANVTVGVQIAEADDVRPHVPGAIQERFGTNQFRFPIPQGTAATTQIIEAGDTLAVTPVDRAPSTVNQGVQDVPMLSLNMRVNRDTVLVKRLQVREDGTSDLDTDVFRVSLYDDPEQDGAIGLNDVLLASAPLSNQVADFQGLSYLVQDGTPKSLLITVTLSDFATIGKTLTMALPDVSLITLSDASDTVSVANFPIASSPTLIERTGHTLFVSASSTVLPFVDPGAQDAPFEKLVLTPDAGTVTLNGLTVRQAGTGSVGATGDLAAIKVYRDTNLSGLLEVGVDELLTPTSTFVDTDSPADGVNDGVAFTSADGSFPANFGINAGSSETLFLAADVGAAGVATVGNTIDLALVSAASIDASPDTVVLSSGTFPVQSGPATVRGLVNVVVGDSVIDGTLVPQGALDQFMFRLDVTALNSDLTFDTLTIGRGGTGTDGDVATVKAYLDSDDDQFLSATIDTLLGSAPFVSGQVIFSGLNRSLFAGQTISLFVVYDLSGSAAANVTLTAQLLSASAIAGPGVQVDPTVAFPLSSNGIIIQDAPPRIESCEASRTEALVKFSEPVQPTEAENAANLQIERPAGTVIHSATQPLNGLRLTYNAGIRSLQIRGVSFVFGDEVKFTVVNVLDLAGNVITPPTNTCTTTAGQNVTPEIQSCDVDETGRATVVYSKDVDPNGAGAAPADLANFALVVSGATLDTSRARIAYDATTRTTTITGLTVTLGAAYQLTISNVTDIFGNPMVQDGVKNVCSGTVSDASNPTADELLSHANGILVRYSEPMDPATTAVPARYTVTESGAAVTVQSVSLNTAGDVATLVPAQALTLTGTLTVVVRDVTDLAGRVISPNPTRLTGSVGVQLTIPGHGLTLFSVPMILAPPNNDPARVLGAGAKVARFDPVLSQYQVYPTTQFGFAPGVGYWARFNVDTPLVLSQGQLVSTLVPFVRALPTRNWDLFGNPFLNGITWDVDALKVRVGGAEVPMRQLVVSPNPAMEVYAWGYDALTRDYFLIGDPRIIPGVRAVIDPATAVWVRSNDANVSLVVPPPTRAASGSRAAAAPAAGEDHWSLELIARCGDATDTGNLMGVSRGRSLNVEAPPAEPEKGRFVELSFVESGGADGRAKRTEVDLRSSVPGRAAWDVEVRSDLAERDVRVQWPDLSQVPRRYRLRLHDLLTGQSVSMRTARHYSFRNERAGVTVRRLRVELLPAEEGALRITNVGVISGGRGPAAGLTVSYALNRQAEVQIRVLSPSGRQVGIALRQTAPAGVSRAAWSTREARGRALPRGVYLVEITARDDEGQAARAVRTAAIR